MNQRLLIGLVFCILVHSVYCDSLANDSEPSPNSFSDNPFFSGDVFFSLDQGSYAAGETLRTNITVANMEDFPLVGCRLVIDIVEGGPEHEYPSQLSDSDNVFYEDLISGIDLGPNSKKTTSYEYTLPEDLKPGSYRFEVYLENERTTVVGVPSIFVSPKYEVFQVTGTGGFPYARILRNETVFLNESGPVGVPVNASSTVAGSVSVENGLSSESVFFLNVTVCEWDDVGCSGDSILFNKVYNISSPPHANSTAQVGFDAPARPEAYSVRLELMDPSGRLMSLYRSRIIVLGETARIRKIATDDFYYKAGQKGSIKVVVGPSPDHYTSPLVRDARVFVSIAPLGGKEVFSDTFGLPDLSIDSDPAFHVFEFTAPIELSEFTVCSKVESSAGALFDSYCYVVDSTRFLTNETRINVSWGYDRLDRSLNIQICSFNTLGRPARSDVSVFLMGAGNSVEGVFENITLDPCGGVNFSAGEGKHVLLINVLDSDRQFTTPIELTAPVQKVPACGDGVCDLGENTENCCIDCGCGQDSVCVTNACEQGKPIVENNGHGYLFWVGAGLVVIGLLLFVLRLRMRKK